MTSLRYVITRPEGLHARPAKDFVKAAQAMPCDVTVAKGQNMTDAKRLLGVMGLNVMCGEEIIMYFQGDREEDACAAMRAFLRERM